MLNENIILTIVELETGTNQVKTIDVSQATPKTLKVFNNSSAQFTFMVFTESEYEAWLLDSSITDFFIVYAGEQRVVNDLSKFNTRLVVKGTQLDEETHKEDVIFEVIK